MSDSTFITNLGLAIGKSIKENTFFDITKSYNVNQVICAIHSTTNLIHFFKSKVANNQGHNPFEDTTQQYWEEIFNDVQTLNSLFGLLDVLFLPQAPSVGTWLVSDNQWNAKSSYPTAYALLLSEYNSAEDQTETIGSISITYRKVKDGRKIITNETTYNNLILTYGTAWYFLLDTTNEQFKLPYSINGIPQFSTELGKFTREGLPNIIGHKSMGGIPDVTYALGTYGSVAGAFTGTTMTSSRYLKLTDNTEATGYASIDFDASLSNSIYGNSSHVQPNSIGMKAYFLIATAIANSSILDVANLSSRVSSLEGRIHTFRTYKSGNDWYRLRSDGWCEQGGYTSISSGSNVVNFILPFLEKPRIIPFNRDSLSTTEKVVDIFTRGVSTISVDFYSSDSTSIYWKAEGFVNV